MLADLEIVESMVYSRMKNLVIDDVGTKYDMTSADNFSTVESDTEAHFPFVYLTTLNGREVEDDLEGTRINGEYLTYQINVSDNISRERAKEVMNSVQRAMKQMSFNVQSVPIFIQNNPHKIIARFSRYIFEGDTI